MSTAAPVLCPTCSGELVLHSNYNVRCRTPIEPGGKADLELEEEVGSEAVGCTVWCEHCGIEVEAKLYGYANGQYVVEIGPAKAGEEVV